MPNQLERVVDFTKYTLALSAAGFAYTAEVAVKRHDWWIKGVGLAALLCFALAVTCGVLVLGRATKIEALDNEITLLRMGKVHSFFLILGLVMAAVVIFLRIFWQGE